MDIDAPFPTWSSLSPIGHWIQSDLQAGEDGKLDAKGTSFVMDYIGPSPPPGSAAHRYVFLLFEQPTDFKMEDFAPAGGKSVGLFARTRYNFAAFESKAKLGPFVAANFFRSK